MSTSPADIANRALDALGVDGWIGDLEEGTDIAKVMLRVYLPSLQQLLRKAHWNFARRQASLNLLQDATGASTQAQINAGYPSPPTIGTGSIAMRGWVFEYGWPIDCVLARFVPASRCWNGTGIPLGNIAIPQEAQTTGTIAVTPFERQVPTRFLVTYDTIPNMVGGAANWNQIPETSGLMGQALNAQTVILSNQPEATLVYTALVPYPDQWDPLFTEAFVALLAARTAMKLCDKKEAPGIANRQFAMANQALDQARVSDGDEGWNDINREASWIAIRRNGGAYGSRGAHDFGDGGGDGYYGNSYDSGGLGSAY